jgi:holo-[acyl-carrier protein] synthase
MMAARILGVGVDLVEVGRIERAVGRQGIDLLREFLGAAELERCLRSPRPFVAVAACFAAKEALVKAIGTGRSGGVSWADAEVFPGGAPPRLALAGEAGARVAALGARRIHLSLACTRRHAAALVVLEGRRYG